MFLLCLGIPKSILASPSKTWESTIHLIRTEYGISKEGYMNDILSMLFGPGQGATLGPFLWLLCFILIVLSI
jgi:hypothetical protein